MDTSLLLTILVGFAALFVAFACLFIVYDAIKDRRAGKQIEADQSKKAEVQLEKHVQDDIKETPVNEEHFTRVIRDSSGKVVEMIDLRVPTSCPVENK